MTAFLDSNVIVRHLTGDPPRLATRASRLLASSEELLLTDLIVAEVAYVLESFYEVPRNLVAMMLRSTVGHRSVRVIDAELLHRAIELYDVVRLDFAEAYLVACAERSGVGRVASFDRTIDRVRTVQRVEPA